MENDKFLKIIHDVNNILCACSGFTELLLDGEDRDYQKKILKVNLKSFVKISGLLEKTRKDLIKEMDEEST